MDFLENENRESSLTKIFDLIFIKPYQEDLNVFFSASLGATTKDVEALVKIGYNPFGFNSDIYSQIEQFSKKQWLDLILTKFGSYIKITSRNILGREVVVGDYEKAKYLQSLEWSDSEVSFKLPLKVRYKSSKGHMDLNTSHKSFKDYDYSTLENLKRMDEDRGLLLKLFPESEPEDISAVDFISTICNDESVSDYFLLRNILENPRYKSGLLSNSNKPDILNLHLTADKNIVFYVKKFKSQASINCRKDQVCFRSGIVLFWYDSEVIENFSIEDVCDSYFLEFQGKLSDLMKSKGLCLVDVRVESKNCSELLIFGEVDH